MRYQHLAIEKRIHPEILSRLRAATGAIATIIDIFKPEADINKELITIHQQDVQLLFALWSQAGSWEDLQKRCASKYELSIIIESPAGDIEARLDTNCSACSFKIADAENEDFWGDIPHYRGGGFYDPVADEVDSIVKRLIPEPELLHYLYPNSVREP